VADGAPDAAGRRERRRRPFVASKEFWLGVATTVIGLILVFSLGQRLFGLFGGE